MDSVHFRVNLIEEPGYLSIRNRMSLGHLIKGRSPENFRIASAVATAAIRVIRGASWGGILGLRMTER